MHAIIGSVFAAASFMIEPNTSLPSPTIEKASPIEHPSEPTLPPIGQQKDTRLTVIFDPDQLYNKTYIGLEGPKKCVEILKNEAETLNDAAAEERTFTFGICEEPQNITSEMYCMAEQEQETACAKLPRGGIYKVLNGIDL